MDLKGQGSSEMFNNAGLSSGVRGLGVQSLEYPPSSVFEENHTKSYDLSIENPLLDQIPSLQSK